jgi:hypothetical protein
VRGNQAGGNGTAQADGGAVAVEAGGRLVATDSSITANRVVAPAPNGRFADGGGIYADAGATVTIRSSHVDRNSAILSSTFPHSVTSDSHAGGGGILVGERVTISINRSTLDGNVIGVTDRQGDPVGYDAAICVCDGSSSLVMTSSHVGGNRMTVEVASSPVGGSAGVLEADGNSRLVDVDVANNSIRVDATTGRAASGAVVDLFPGTGQHARVAQSRIGRNRVVATSASGTVAVAAAGLINNGQTTLENDVIYGNQVTARARDGWVRGGGIFNGNYFAESPAPTADLTLSGSTVSANAIRVTAGVTAGGAGIYTAGFMTRLRNSTVARNQPDQCIGCGS